MASTSGAAAEQVSGTVLDPQRLPIADAAVTLTCRNDAQSAVTGEHGRFSFVVTSNDNCLLRVVRQGFSTYEQPVTTSGTTVCLQIATVQESVDIPVPPMDIGSTTWRRGVFAASDLAAFSDRFDDWLSLSRALAGVTDAGNELYVDGLPSRVPPLPGTIRSITIAADPFSAEYADVNRIDVSTGAPARRWHTSLGGDLLPFGARSVFDPNALSRTHAISADLSGAIGRTPATISLQGRDERFDIGSPITGLAPGTVNVTRHAWTEAARVFLPIAPSTEIRLLMTATGDIVANAGAGELVTADAAGSSDSSTYDSALTIERKWPAAIWRSSVMLSAGHATTHANAGTLGLRILGALTTGGAATQNSSDSDTAWTWKSVIEPTTRRWKAGVIVGRAALDRFEVPNPVGFVEFSTAQQYADALAGVSGGVWTGERGTLNVHASTVTTAVFGERAIVDRPRLSLRFGLRGDQQTDDGLRLSPRTDVAVRLHGWDLRSGAGLFTRAWSLDSFVPSLAAPSQWQRLIADRVTIVDGHAMLSAQPETIASTVAPDFARRRDVIARASLSRTEGVVRPAIEYTFDSGSHLAGSRRFTADGGWIDVLESNRRFQSGELRGSLRLSILRQRFTANYEWLVSNDDTAGAFSFPQKTDDLAAEWAPTAGIARHNAQVVDMLVLPWAWSLAVVASARSGVPYNITSGLDPGASGLFTDRAGLPRNYGMTPASASVDLSASRHVQVRWPRMRPFGATLGVRATNLFFKPAYTSFGSVLSSPLAGHPLTATPGYGLRVWMSVGGAS